MVMKLKEISRIKFFSTDDIWSGYASLRFYKETYLHNSDGPALIDSMCYKEWWQHGKFIRNNFDCNET